jgi:hypothetical protein
MDTRTLVSAMVVGILVSCGTPPPPTTPSDEPVLPEEYRAESEEPELDASELEASEPEEPAPEEPAPELPEQPEAAEPASAAEPSAPAKQGCDGLAKGRCKVTQGCAWHDQKRACVRHREEF